MSTQIEWSKWLDPYHMPNWWFFTSAAMAGVIVGVLIVSLILLI